MINNYFHISIICGPCSIPAYNQQDTIRRPQGGGEFSLVLTKWRHCFIYYEFNYLIITIKCLLWNKQLNALIIRNSHIFLRNKSNYVKWKNEKFLSVTYVIFNSFYKIQYFTRFRKITFSWKINRFTYNSTRNNT